MNGPLVISHDAEAAVVEIAAGGGNPLWSYRYRPDTRAEEAPRPYAHPVRSLEGDVLTLARPNDHPWHHGLSLTLTHLDGVNFWGGPSHRAEDGYQWREDQGSQVHRRWLRLAAEALEHEVDWLNPRTGEVLLHERRRLETSLLEGGWSLRWHSVLENATGRALALGNYHSLNGLSGSHYTGLQFRGARALLDDHGDSGIGILAEPDLRGEEAVHGAQGRWMEWHCQCDTSLRRVRICFEALGEPVHWFVRRHNPLAAFSPHREMMRTIAMGASLALDHKLTFTNL